MVNVLLFACCCGVGGGMMVDGGKVDHQGRISRCSPVRISQSVEASGFAASGTEEEWGGLLRLWAGLALGPVWGQAMQNLGLAWTDKGPANGFWQLYGYTAGAPLNLEEEPNGESWILAAPEVYVEDIVRKGEK
ncbi:hypothetical protein F4860DRAFT_523941 [Xylaria cubensis]|nr:hypothetical protein F4860DRAFT_523941 [Xylaria cubensis]